MEMTKSYCKGLTADAADPGRNECHTLETRADRRSPRLLTSDSGWNTINLITCTLLKANQSWQKAVKRNQMQAKGANSMQKQHNATKDHHNHPRTYVTLKLSQISKNLLKTFPNPFPSFPKASKMEHIFLNLHLNLVQSMPKPANKQAAPAKILPNLRKHILILPKKKKQNSKE